MATYKKRGGKIKSKSEAVNDSELLEGESTTAEVFNTLDETANKTEEWVEKNQKVICLHESELEANKADDSADDEVFLQVVS